MNLISAWDSDAPLVIAHRGASRYAPENTLAAFRLAAEIGADAIELDAQLTADEHIVVLHDRWLDRTTNGKGLVSEKGLAELKKLDAGSTFDIAFAGEKIPLLAEVFQEVGQQLLINIEMKNIASPFDSLPFFVLQLVEKYKMQNRVLLSSFNPIALRKVHTLSADIPLGLLLGSEEFGWMRWFFRRISPHDALHLSDDLVTLPFLKEAQRKKKHIIVWTVNTEDRIRTLINEEIDGIITDVPDVAKRLVAMG
jgi:glycerophosphoryl diester phosphodiesterase